jgi:hypothetical protein
MTELTIVVNTVCKSCLEPRDVDDDGLCDHCADFNDSIDGALIALINN